MTSPYSEDAHGLGLSDDLDAFSEISLNQSSSACNTPEPATAAIAAASSLPSFQETYANLGFKMEEDHFGFANQVPFPPAANQQSVGPMSGPCSHASSCGVQYDFGQLFSPLSSSYFQGGGGGQPMYGQEAQMHAHMPPYAAQPSPAVFDAPQGVTPQLEQQIPYNMAPYSDVNAMGDVAVSPQAISLKQRRTQRNHPLLR